MNAIILYQSKHGSTKQYADWIGEETGFPVIDLKKNKKPELGDKDIVIIGSWVLAARMVAHSWIKKNWSKIQPKNVIIFSVGADEPNDELRKKYIDSSLPPEAKDKVAFFALHGRFRKEDQGALIRGMLNFAVKFEKDGDSAKNMISGVDGVKKENLKELLEHVASL
jgi:menaquinone-dependent protoporphyrinogen IX oxidase